jgi:RNA polymerase-binding protein DksA
VCYRPAPMSAAKKPARSRSGSSTSSGSRAGSAAKKTASKKKSTTKKTAARKAAARKKTPARTTKSSARGKARSSQSSSSGTTAKKSRAAGTRPTKAAARRSSARPAKLDAKALDKIRRQLEEERSGLEAQMADLEEESFRGTQSELTGEVGIDEDFADAGSATFDREQALSIQNNIRDLIDQVDRALYRIQEGTYGACERCGRPIEAARLKAIPRTLLCTECKRREERAR